MEKKIKAISILGCGWLGLALGKKLAENTHHVKGSTTNLQKFEKLKNANIEPFLINLPENYLQKEVIHFLQADVLIIAIPPKVRSNGFDYHLSQLKKIFSLKEISGIQEIIYISSTSVYTEENIEVDETSKTNENTTLVLAEAMVIDFCKSINIQYTILRCAGLMGFDRYPAKYISNKNLVNGSKPVNYIHLTDLVEMITKLLHESNTSEIYNVCAPLHPTRAEVFTKNSKDAGLEEPTFEENTDEVPFKVINANKLIEKLNYKFIYPDPLHFYYTFNA